MLAGGKITFETVVGQMTGTKGGSQSTTDRRTVEEWRFTMPVFLLSDNVRAVSTPLTVSLGLAGLAGQVYGETTLSVTGVEVVGGSADDYAINVQLSGREESLWGAPELLEFVDHAPGTKLVIGSIRFVRSVSGEGKRRWCRPTLAKNHARKRTPLDVTINCTVTQFRKSNLRASLC